MSDISNQQAIDYGAEESRRLQQDYPWIETDIVALKAERDRLRAAHPNGVQSDDDMAPFAILEKNSRDLAKRILGFHDLEKMPHLRRGQATDKFFFGHAEDLAKSKKTAPDGFADSINAEFIAPYMNAKLDRERKAREEVERQAREREAAARQEREEADRVAREAEAKAARARNEESRQKAEEAARIAREDADRKRETERQRSAETDTARDSANAKPADMVGTRVGNDAKVTMKPEYYARVTDHGKLPASELWAFVSDKAKEEALGRFAKTTNHARQIPGAVIGYTERPVTK